MCECLYGRGVRGLADASYEAGELLNGVPEWHGGVAPTGVLLRAVRNGVAAQSGLYARTMGAAYGAWRSSGDGRESREGERRWGGITDVCTQMYARREGVQHGGAPHVGAQLG